MFGRGELQKKPLQPGIYSTKLLFDPDYSPLLKQDKDPIINFDRYKDEFENLLKQLLKKLFSPEEAFPPTTNEKKCRTCPYASICRK